MNRTEADAVVAEVVEPAANIVPALDRHRHFQRRTAED